MFNPLRLTLARKRRGMKKRELAEKIGLTEKSVSNYEAGSQEPESTTLSKLSEALRFPEAFFLVMTQKFQLLTSLASVPSQKCLLLSATPRWERALLPCC